VQTIADETGELELRDYLRVLQRRKWTVVLVAALVVAASVVASLSQTPVYRATAEVLLQPRTTESIFDPSVVQNLTGGKQAPTEIRVVKSDPVRALVSADLGSAPSVSVSNPAETDFLLISAESTDPERAATVANAYGRAYVEFRRQQAVSDLEKASDDLEQSIAEIDEELNARPATAPAGSPAGVIAAQGQETLLSQRTFFSSRLQQIQLAIKQKTGGAQLQTPAVAPTEPVRPTPARNAVVALFVGLILGVGLAFLRDYLDESITGKEELERTVPGLTVLGLIPTIPGWKEGEKPVVVSLTETASPAAESYRALRTSVQFLGVERPLRVIQVTSASKAEGKSTTVANLAVALARAGQRVTIVDCDLRRPRIHQFFGMANDIGLTSVLIGEATIGSAVQAVPDVPNLYLLPSGPRPPNPSELLAGQHVAEILGSLEEGSLVIIDCPPVLPVTDAVVLSGKVHGTLLVATAGETRQKELRRTREVLDQVGAPLIGLLLNGVNADDSYGYSYRYAYSEVPPPGRKSEAAVGRA
jgi:polysaccharide biosynthesis transport protein